MTPALQGGAVMTPALQGGAVMTPALQGGAVMTPALQGGAVMTPALQGGAVMTPALQGGAAMTPALQGGVCQSSRAELTSARHRSTTPQSDTPSCVSVCRHSSAERILTTRLSINQSAQTSMKDQEIPPGFHVFHHHFTIQIIKRPRFLGLLLVGQQEQHPACKN